MSGLSTSDSILACCFLFFSFLLTVQKPKRYKRVCPLRSLASILVLFHPPYLIDHETENSFSEKGQIINISGLQAPQPLLQLLSSAVVMQKQPQNPTAPALGQADLAQHRVSEIHPLCGIGPLCDSTTLFIQSAADGHLGSSSSGLF